MDQAERHLLEEIALRNAIAKFRRLNARRNKRATMPHVGIFSH